MKTKDYYKILEISELATDAEIKSAYRKLARKYHPDIAGATTDAITKFKAINEAYNTLIDKQARYNYDALRRLYSYAQKSYTSSSSTADKKEDNTTSKPNFNNFWSEFVQPKRAKETSSNLPKDGSDITTEVVISLQEAYSGTEKKVNILHTAPCPHCKGRKFVNGTKCAECDGKGYVSEHKRLTVKIPAGIKNGYKIRIVGEGNQGAFGGKNGNLYLLIKIENNSDFKYDGVNITKTIPITPFEAVLGADIEIPVLDGKLTMKIFPNTNSGQKFRLQGQGLTKNGVTGDLIVTVEIKIPNNLSVEERELYKKLAKLSTSDIRKAF